MSAHSPPALPAPPWHPCLPLSPGPLPLHGPGPPIPPPTPPPFFRSPCWALGKRLEAVPLRGGSVRSPARRPPSLRQRVPPPFLLDSSLHSTHLCTHPLITSLHTPVHLLITLSCSQCVDYLCTSAPSLCLPRLLLPALTCACLYFTVFRI